MISLKAGIAISVATLIVFGGVAYFTLNASTPSLTLSSTGYFSIDNHTSKEYFVSNATSELNINFTVYSNILPIDMPPKDRKNTSRSPRLRLRSAGCWTSLIWSAISIPHFIT